MRNIALRWIRAANCGARALPLPCARTLTPDGGGVLLSLLVWQWQPQRFDAVMRRLQDLQVPFDVNERLVRGLVRAQWAWAWAWAWAWVWAWAWAWAWF